MFGMDALLTNPATIRLAIKSFGLEAARLDYHAPTKALWLSVKVKGRVRQIPVPLGRQLTAEEIFEILVADQPGQMRSRSAGAPAPIAAADVATDPPPP